MSEAKPDAPKAPTAADALKILADERQARALACEEDLNVILAKHNCELWAAPYVTDDGRLAAQYGIHARPAS